MEVLFKMTKAITMSTTIEDVFNTFEEAFLTVRE